MRWSAGVCLCVLAKGQQTAVAVADDKLTLSLHALLRAVENHCARTPQLLGQYVRPGYVEIDVIGRLGAAGPDLGLIGTI